tara:strand:- start:75 stop:287 length:213 start_codon:yes stop_codon:yes gene_type:complete
MKIGAMIFFSNEYNPGAIKLQIWWRTNGIVIKNDVTKANLNGVKNGEATSVAIILESGGIRSLSGSEMIA